MAKKWVVELLVVLVSAGCRVPPRTTTEGAKVVVPDPPKRQPEVTGEFNDESDLADGLEMLLAATPPRGWTTERLREHLARVLTKRLAKKLDDDTLRRIFDWSLVLARRPDPVAGERVGGLVLESASSLPESVRKLLFRVSELILERFEPHGDVAESLLGYAVEGYLGRDVQQQGRRFSEILQWLYVSSSQKGRHAGLSAVLTQLEQTAGRFPSPLVLSALKTWSQKVSSAGDAALEPSSTSALAGLLSGDFRTALSAVSAQARPDELLRNLLAKVTEKTASSADFFALANFFRQEHPLVSEAICRAAVVRFPESPVPWFCLGDLAEARGATLKAMADYERVLRLNADWWAAWNRLAGMYMSRLATLVSRQDFDAVERLVRVSLGFHRAAMVRWPAKPFKVDMSSVYYVSAQAWAAQGKMEEAFKAYSASLKYRRRADVLVEKGNIAFWQHKYRKALRFYNAALNSVPDGGRRVYWLSKVALPMALCFRRLGDEKQARFVLIKAAGSLLRLSTLLRDKTLRAVLLVSIAEIVDALGRRDHALRLLDIAVDTTGNLESIYPLVMTFYVSRGLVDQALDMYTRATTKQVAEYHRAYATFWVLNLGRRCKVEPVRLSVARAALEDLKGHHWYDRLAAWMRGELSDEQVARYAKRPGDRLELTYYRAMKYLGSGRVEDARRLWRKIGRTNMYVYFEYRLADWYLRHGAPCAGGTPSARPAGNAAK